MVQRLHATVTRAYAKPNLGLKLLSLKVERPVQQVVSDILRSKLQSTDTLSRSTRLKRNAETLVDVYAFLWFLSCDFKCQSCLSTKRV